MRLLLPRMWRGHVLMRSFVKYQLLLSWKLIDCLSFLPKEPPKEDLTVSEKFQLVLDVAQKAQVLCYSHTSPAASLKHGGSFILKWSMHFVTHCVKTNT